MTAYPDLHLYIGGAWRKTRAELPVLNPATEQVVGLGQLADDLTSTMRWTPLGKASAYGAARHRATAPR